MSHRPSIPGANTTAGERGGNILIGLEVSPTDHCSRQGQNLALTGLCVPSSLDCGTLNPNHPQRNLSLGASAVPQQSTTDCQTSQS